MATKKVYIGVGHGGSDPGAVANGFKESNLNLDVAQACAEALKRSGVSVKISRTADTEVWLEKRIKEANAFKADVALDIHHNAGSGGGGDGAEVYHSIYRGEGEELAENILQEMKAIGQNSRGAKIKKNSSGLDYFGFIRQTTMPAVLVEVAFVDNKTDLAIVDTPQERKAMGEAIAKGVCKTIGVTYKTESVKQPTATTTKPTQPVGLTAGQAVRLTNAPLYASARAKTVAARKTGTFYLWSKDVVNGRVRITNSKANVGKDGQVTGFVAVADLNPGAGFEPYHVKVTTPILNVRAGAGTGYKVNTTVRKNEVYTIVDEKNGWGKLKSGAGWVALEYTQKL